MDPGSRPQEADLTVLLDRLGQGDPEARDRVVAAVYGELRMLARQRLAKGPEVSLQATELVHEMYTRLFRREDLNWENRRHFFGVAARAMQDIVIDRARRAAAQKRGGEAEHVRLSRAFAAATESPEDVVLLGEALDRLGDVDPMAAEIVRLRYFVGLSGDETAEALGVSPATVDRRWVYAKTWLHRAMRGEDGNDGAGQG